MLFLNYASTTFKHRICYRGGEGVSNSLNCNFPQRCYLTWIFILRKFYPQLYATIRIILFPKPVEFAWKIYTRPSGKFINHARFKQPAGILWVHSLLLRFYPYWGIFRGLQDLPGKFIFWLELIIQADSFQGLRQ